MKNYKKKFLGSLFVLIVGSSCCWLSTLAIWVGGAVIFGTISSFIAGYQAVLLVIGVLLLLISFGLYLKNRKHSD